MNLKKQVKKALQHLIKKNGQTTTLDVKLYLRKKFPTESIKQLDVSQACDVMHSTIKGFAFYTDTNGADSYRVYYNLNGKQKSKKKGTMQKITRTKLIDLIINSKGRMLTINYNSKSGSNGDGTSTTNGQYKSLTAMGYHQIKNPKKGIRSFMATELNWAKINKVKYVVK